MQGRFRGFREGNHQWSKYAGGPAKEASGMASALIIAKKRQQREEFQQAITAQEEGTNLRTDKFSTLKPTRSIRCVPRSPREASTVSTQHATMQGGWSAALPCDRLCLCAWRAWHILG